MPSRAPCELSWKPLISQIIPCASRVLSRRYIHTTPLRANDITTRQGHWPDARPHIIRRVFDKPQGWDHPLQAIDNASTSVAAGPEDSSEFAPLDPRRKDQALAAALGSIAEDLRDEFPLSPFERMKQKWNERETKRMPTKAEKERMSHNPWAVMLASPLRLESATRSRFPLLLLTGWSLTKSPADGQTYMMPDDLGDLEAFKKRIQTRKQKAATVRPHSKHNREKVEIIPYKLLLEDLTDSFLVWDTVTSAGRTKKAAVGKRLISTRAQQIAVKVAAYQNASKDYWDLREKQGELDSDLFKRPEKPTNLDDIQWQPAIAERIANIMRQRVLIALNEFANKQYQSPRVTRRNTYCFNWPENADLGLSSFVASKCGTEYEHWNDMGDIESPDAIGGGGHNQGNRNDPRPPIAVQPSEIEQGSPTMLRDRNNPHEWLPGSFVLHIGPARDAISALPYLDPSSVPSAEDTSTDSVFNSQSKFITPMINVADIARLPVFNIQALLGSEFSNVFMKTLHKRRHLLMQDMESEDSQALTDLNYIVVVKGMSPGSQFLAHELWQLWRYLGGRDCLRDAAGVRAVSEIDDHRQVGQKRLRKGKSDYHGLSEKAWKHLYKLLELEGTDINTGRL